MHIPYIVKHKNRIDELLVIYDSSGKETLRVPVHLHIDDILAQYNRIRRIIGEAQHNAQEDPENEVNVERLGRAVVSLFELIFGRDGCEKIIKEYENRYTDMLEEIAPFINDVITPKINAAMVSRIKRYKKFSKR